jgi:AraC family L-rhamnose operon transcriptional activator RhaR
VAHPAADPFSRPHPVSRRALGGLERAQSSQERLMPDTRDPHSNAPSAAQGHPQDEFTMLEWEVADAKADRPRRSEGLEVSLVRSGSGILRFDAQVVRIEEGDLFVFPPGRDHLLLCRGAVPVKILTLRCAAATVEQILGSDRGPSRAGNPPPAALDALVRADPRVPRDSRAAGFAAALLHQLHAAQPAPGRGGAIWARSKLLELFGILLEHATTEAVVGRPAPPGHGRRREAIARLIDAMARADVSELSVEAVALSLNLSVRHFRRLFRQETGRSFHGFVTDLRVNHAKEALVRSDKKVIEVAQESGYSSLSQFNLVFRNRTGLSPGQYRTRHRRK